MVELLEAAGELFYLSFSCRFLPFALLFLYGDPIHRDREARSCALRRVRRRRRLVWSGVGKTVLCFRSVTTPVRSSKEEPGGAGRKLCNRLFPARTTRCTVRYGSVRCSDALFRTPFGAVHPRQHARTVCAVFCVSFSFSLSIAAGCGRIDCLPFAAELGPRTALLNSLCRVFCEVRLGERADEDLR